MDNPEQNKKASPTARVIAVTSGKGGVGKTNFAVSLSIALAELGDRVTLVDMDLGLGNVSMLFDINPEHNLSDVLSNKMDINSVIVNTPYGVSIVPGVSGDEEFANLDDKQKQKLVESMESLCINNDYVIIDTGAGISKNSTTFTESADEAIVVTSPEPTSMMDAYAMIKVLNLHVPKLFIHLVINMARGENEASIAMSKMQSLAEHFIHHHLEEDGYIPMDEKVVEAVRNRKPFIVYAPSCRASLALTRIANAITNVHTSPSGHIHDRKDTFFSRLMQSI